MYALNYCPARNCRRAFVLRADEGLLPGACYDLGQFIATQIKIYPRVPGQIIPLAGLCVGRGGALVESITFNRRVMGSTPALAVTTPALAVTYSCLCASA